MYNKIENAYMRTRIFALRTNRKIKNRGDVLQFPPRKNKKIKVTIHVDKHHHHELTYYIIILVRMTYHIENNYQI